MQTLLVVFHVFLTLGLIGLVLIQHGKGADAGAAFGSGASSTVFGARGSGSFLTRATAVLAALFFVSSMTLGYFSSQANKAPGLMEAGPEPGVAIESPKAVEVPEVPPAPPSEVPTTSVNEVPVPNPGEAAPEPPKSGD